MAKHRDTEPMLFDHPRWWVLMWMGATMGAIAVMVFCVVVL